MLRTVISMRGGLIGCSACKYFNSMALDEVGNAAIIKSDGSLPKITQVSKPFRHGKIIYFPRQNFNAHFVREGDNV